MTVPGRSWTNVLGTFLTSMGRPNLASKGYYWEVVSGRPQEVLRTSPTGSWKHVLGTMWGHLFDEILENIQIPSSNLYINSYAFKITEPTFGAKITTYFWKVLTSHAVQNKPLKNPALWWAIQFQFNCELWIQLYNCESNCTTFVFETAYGFTTGTASSLKSIFVPNVRVDFHIYTVRQSVTLTKMSKWWFV